MEKDGLNAGVPEDFLKPFNPGEHEKTLYARWEESGYFNPDTCIKKGVAAKDAPHYSIVLPPPNVTGTLHMGHAAMLAIEDTLVRHARMKGLRTLWLPGTDHAAIATQSKVEKELQKKEGVSRHDLGREEFLKRVEQFAKDSHDTIVNQVRRMGSSVDWSREAYTLDEARSLAVRTAFKAMYDAGLIYRGDRIVNWDPKGQTTISDDEMVYEERTATLYTFRYWKGFPIPISTTRPETKVGDTAVAVHPDDERYAAYVGKEFSDDVCGVPVTVRIVADLSVDKEFGTGALGVTPAHSHIDWDIARRHGLPLVQVIDEKARMTVGDERLKGKKVAEARAAIVEWLRGEGLIEKEEEIAQNVSTAERTGAVIEPLPKLQWWIAVDKPFSFKGSGIPGIAEGDMVTLKEVMKRAVESGATTILPERFERIYYNWIDNLRDWCISRQIWFGHRIPVWYKKESGARRAESGEEPHAGQDARREVEEMYVGVEAPTGDGWEQDPDTLDTWFSSGLWTFSTLGWPEETQDLRDYHPTTILETGYDIIFFWVARMMLMTGFNLGTIPFTYVYLHGLVRDGQGRKMSKSLGNIIDPLDMIEKYGADAARLSLLIGAQPGNDLKLSEDKIRGYKHFANKLWNIARFVLGGVHGADIAERPPLTAQDEAHLKRLDEVVRAVNEHIEKFRLDIAADTSYHYAWDEFAAKIIEESKPILAGDDEVAKRSRQWFLAHALTTQLKLLHPFMPFVTEAIWQRLPQKDTEFLMIAKWPQ